MMSRRKRTSGQNKTVSSDSDELKGSTDIGSKPEITEEPDADNQLNETAEVRTQLFEQNSKELDVVEKQDFPRKGKKAGVRKVDKKATGQKSPSETDKTKKCVENKGVLENDNIAKGKRTRKVSGQHVTATKGKRRRVSSTLFDAMDIIKKHTENSAKTDTSLDTNTSSIQTTVQSGESVHKVSQDLENNTLTENKGNEELSSTEIRAIKKTKAKRVTKRSTVNSVGIRVLQNRLDKRSNNPKLKHSQRLKVIASSLELEGSLSSIARTSDESASHVVNGFTDGSTLIKGTKGKSRNHRRTASTSLLETTKINRKRRKSGTSNTLGESETINTSAECDEKIDRLEAEKKKTKPTKLSSLLPSMDDDVEYDGIPMSQTVDQTSVQSAKQDENTISSEHYKTLQDSATQNKRGRRRKSEPAALQKDNSLDKFSTEREANNTELSKSSLTSQKLPGDFNGEDDGGPLPELHTSSQSKYHTKVTGATSSKRGTSGNFMISQG